MLRPVVNTAPAMPASFGMRIFDAPSPCPISVYSSLVAGSLRNSVERSESSMRVTADMIFCSSGPRWISLDTSATSSRNSASIRRSCSVLAMNSVPCSTIDACVAIAATRSRSRGPNSPASLLRHCTTPMISPLMVRIGTARMLRVR